MHMKNSQIPAEDTLQKVNQLFESNPAPVALSSLPERTFPEVFCGFAPITGAKVLVLRLAEK